MAIDKAIDSAKEAACRTAEANAIRAKTGSTAQITYDWANSKGFAAAIDSIPAGSAPSLQSKSVTYTANGTDTITPDAGYDGLSSVDVTVNVSGGGGGSGVLDALIDRSITEISNDHVTSVGFFAFAYCMNLTTADLPACESIGNFAFMGCMNLQTINFSVVTSIGENAFVQCTGLTTLDFPVAASIGSYAFEDCSGLTTVDFPVATSIGDAAFQGCSGLTSLILRSMENVCTLSTVAAFNNTPIKSGTGYIYVPAALVDSYKAATNWTTYANQIRAIEDYPEITGG